MANANEQYVLNFARVCALSRDARDASLTFDARCVVEQRMERARQKMRFWETRPDFRFDLIDGLVQSIKNTYAS